MTMGPVDVFLRFDPPLTDEQRDEFLKLLRAKVWPDFDVTERDGQTCLHFHNAAEKGALTRADAVVKALCDGTTINPDLIVRSLEGDRR